MSKLRGKEFDVDLCVSCDGSDRTFVKQHLIGRLKESGFSIWFADKPDMENDSGLAILQCKIFIPILSEESANSETFDNELSLAYVANKSIVPIATKSIRKINPLLSNGVKLMLAKINWTFLIKPENYDETILKLIEAIRTELNNCKLKQMEKDDDISEEDIYRALNNHAPNVDIHGGDYETFDDQMTCEHLQTSINCDFWERHFLKKNEVLWTEFKARFLADYGQRITRQLGEGKETWLTLFMYKDIFELYKIITKQKYRHFCGCNTTANPDQFYDRVKSYVTDMSAMKKVFNMASGVRLVAIQNLEHVLGSFQTPSVLTLLFDLVDHSEDPNVRALASLALAKAGKKSQHIENRLIRLLKDEDRLVRESACLSLAHIKCTRAVTDILELWRNDAIKHVREAAELALLRMGGTEAEKAIHITQVLSDEMKQLRESKVN
ncbi:hypothetical protein LSH36_171g02047 [Paralvinella palmiformis]|uniref:TIR domain-containing protein n=1 Tax=Paralvinella palmiformis TaxID=53620 RepID=A0AAD9JS76_9ANNE|nr:hypothetical protein LSH36_171g02047 [Paralvinella palmiformis]